MGPLTPSLTRDLTRLQRALGDHLELGPVIGRGGFAEVFLVRDLRLKRDLALKALQPDLLISETLLTRFRREAETVAALRHPHIVPIYDIGEADGIAYILMPFIKGESLKSLIQREGPRPPREASRILLEAAEALSAAHETGVIHRDIKPENIMLEGKGRRVLLMDFGIAKAIDASELALTSSGMLVGTPQYMSPEQASGDQHLDHRTDQYSLAVVGYQMLTGALPFDGESMRAVIFQHIVATPRALRDLVPDVPAHLAFAVERALAKEAKDRYPTMEDFAEAIRAGEGSVTVRPSEPVPIPTAGATPQEESAVTAAPPQLTTPRRPRAVWYAGAAGLGTLVLVAGILLARRSGGAPQAPPSQAAVPAPAPAPPSAATGTPLPVAPATCAAATKQPDWVAALKLCRSEAEKGNVASARLLAGIYQQGKGTPRNDSLAAVWYRRGADAGDPQSQFRLGLLYASATGVPRDEAEATKLLRRAAERDVADAWPVLAERFDQGLGTKKNEAEAAFWYRKSAERGNVAAQYSLAVMYARGRGVQKNDAEARSWFERAAASGHAAAQYELGIMYLRGKGVAKSESLGLAWLTRAAAQGNPEAQKEVARRQRP